MKFDIELHSEGTSIEDIGNLTESVASYLPNPWYHSIFIIYLVCDIIRYDHILNGELIFVP